jgi:Secretion system C-terminal sorting domain
MKKLLYVVTTLLSFVGHSQMTLTKLNGTPINNGDIISFDTAAEPSSYLGIKVLNNSSSDINVKIKIESIINADGSNLQLCFGFVCFGSIVAGNSYPNVPAVIPANDSNGNFDHFLNTNTGTVAGQNVEYVFKFYQVDENNFEIGNSITFTYRYSPNLATATFNELNAVGIQVKNTIATTSLNFVAVAPVTTTIYDVNGRVVASTNTGSGNQSIDVSNLSSSIYIAQFTTLEGKKATVKFVKN